MNNKIKLYSHILNFGICNLKATLGGSFFRRSYRNKSRVVSELLHLIPPLLHTTEYNKGDIYFIEHGLKLFIESYPDKADVIFLTITDASLSVYDEICCNHKVKWTFPEGLRASIENYRIKNNSLT